MNPTLIDHLFVVLLAAPFPLWAVWDYRRFVANLRAGKPGARIRAYRETLAVEWGLALIVVLLWAGTGREAGLLGVHLEAGKWWWVGAILTLAISTFLVVQVVAVRRHKGSLEKVRAQVEALSPLFPGTPGEVRWFNALSVTAGICEELVYRGYLMAYLTTLAGTPAAVLLSSAAFGIGHAYQGPAGMAKTFGVGLTMALVSLLTGSLWAPILLHALIDITGGMVGRFVLARPDGDLPGVATASRSGELRRPRVTCCGTGGSRSSEGQVKMVHS